jgi:hypothetical protein
MYIRVYLAILLIVLWFQLDVTEGMIGFHSMSGAHSFDPMIVISVILLIVIFLFLMVGIPIIKGYHQFDYDDD